MWKRAGGWAVGLAVAAGPAWAQAGEAAPKGSGQGMNLVEIFKAGGWLMYPIAALSVLAVAFILYLLIVLRAEAVAPRRWLQKVFELLRQGHADEARGLCDGRPSPLAAVTAAALDYVAEAKPVQPDMLKEIMVGEGIRQATRIQNQVQYLMDIAVIAPMIGLLGTVVGMLQAFNAIALDLAKAKPMLLAAGVSLALITTVAGLVVAIPAMIFYAYFRNRSSAVVARLEMASTDLLTHLLGRAS
ncbi:MAG TPA: MotA/TolQ/ExbB proton channel family protein [Kiritimatiellia bacterium]|nr:MotA/TolQ/ExbB proton channel family protein [Kiritimatiellia bacterium]HRZ13538.1 MotA/TolQ/ExbB proton channel family protein [Kiritimatiellia bacterium]HSA19157.1 MotA/TolQ/ExbB proton channel family protein [Kiritimatiellia bacterium]